MLGVPAPTTISFHPSVDAALPRLERRDLRQVEHVAHEQPVAGHLDTRKAVDREVAERVCRGRRRDGKRRGRNDDEQKPFHDAYFQATGDHRTEKCGLSSTARRNQPRATAVLPRQRSIMPRWKNLRASRVPRRRASRE